jgi:GNAT superfamily N-acetyltransferase
VRTQAGSDAKVRRATGRPLEGGTGPQRIGSASAQEPEISSARQGSGYLIFASDDTGVLGSARVTESDGDTAELTDLHVEAARRGSGYGRAVVASAAQHARDMGKPTLTLTADDDGSGRLENWYRSLGFADSGTNNLGYAEFEAPTATLTSRLSRTSRPAFIQRMDAKKNKPKKKNKWHAFEATPEGVGPDRTNPNAAGLNLKSTQIADEPYVHAIGRMTLTFRVLQVVRLLYRQDQGLDPQERSLADSRPRHRREGEDLTTPWQANHGKRPRGYQEAHVLLRTIYIDCGEQGLKYVWNLKNVDRNLLRLMIGLHATVISLPQQYNDIDGLVESEMMELGVLQRLLSTLPQLPSDEQIWYELREAYCGAVEAVCRRNLGDQRQEARAVYLRAADRLRHASPMTGFDSWLRDIQAAMLGTESLATSSTTE